MGSPIRVLVNGAAGKMGQEAVKAISQAEGLTLVGGVGKHDDLVDVIAKTQAQVVLDLTTASAAFENANRIIEAGAYPLIGTSGLLEHHIQVLTEKCQQKKIGGLIVPNFSIGAVLSMQYARDCARYFPAVEIIELHHHKKADAPSGTAIRAAELIAQNKAKALVNPLQQEILPGARGASHQDIPIHSVRLPGLLAHQVIMFGGTGELFTIKHDITSREAYMPGICLACRKIMTLGSLKVGLEHVLEPLI
jgi:4-hydroxy-tetrahydrodipicolinate reductase